MNLLQEPELWVAIGLAILVGLLIRAKAPGMALKALDSRATKIQAELDEALRLRQEAEALLAQIKAQRLESEQQAAEMLANARTESELLAADAEVKLVETIKRRQLMAERKIANAQAQAEADVKAAAADLAAQLAGEALAARLSGLTTDPLIDRAVTQLGDKLQ